MPVIHTPFILTSCEDTAEYPCLGWMAVGPKFLNFFFCSGGVTELFQAWTLCRLVLQSFVIVKKLFRGGYSELKNVSLGVSTILLLRLSLFWWAASNSCLIHVPDPHRINFHSLVTRRERPQMGCPGLSSTQLERCLCIDQVDFVHPP